jgi:nitric oxide reductase subunit C
MELSKKRLLILVFLIVFFSLYNFTIYTSKSNYGPIQFSKLAVKGEAVWLHNNCNSCHQLYGLGGYLGPDLTNEYTLRGPEFIKAMAVSGVKVMPKFNFNESEKSALVQFLKEVDHTGFYHHISDSIHAYGWVDLHYKKTTYESQ